MKLVSAVLIAVVVYCCAAQEHHQIKHLPDRLKDLVCHKSDEDFDGCIKSIFQKWLLAAVDGIPEFDLPPVDPLRLESFSFERVLSNELKISGVLTNVEAFGAGKLFLQDFRSDSSRLRSETKVRLPYFNTTLDYNIQGLFFGVPFKSEGHFEGNFINIRVYVKSAAIEIERDGVKFLMMDKLRPKTKLEDGHINLVSPDPALQRTVDGIAAYFNNNPSRAVETMQRFYEAYPDDTVLRDLINQQLTLVPESEILPE